MKLKNLILIITLLALQACSTAGSLVVEGYKYEKDSTVVKIMECPLDLCKEYARLALRDMEIPYNDVTEGPNHAFECQLPEKKMEIKFYPQARKLTKVTVKTSSMSNSIKYFNKISEKILDRIDINVELLS
jgi:hypothetical protein